MTIQTTEASTALESTTDTAVAFVANMPATQGTDLRAWVAQLDDAQRLGQALSGTAMVPQIYRGNPGDCAAVVFMGAALGMNPLEALQDIFVVHGTPGLYARAMHKQFNKAGHELIRTEATADAVTVAARRSGTDDWHEFTWTIERAKTAGYTTNKKYQTDPIAMLTAKAIAEAVRLMAPEVLSGISYTAEEIELEDMGERPAPPRPQAKSSNALAEQRQRAAEARKAAPAKAAAPEPQANVETGEIVDDVDWFSRMEPIAEDRKALQALWREAKAAGADDAILESIAAAGTTAKEAA